MPTVQPGVVQALYAPVDDSTTITITAPGRVSINGRNVITGAPVTPRELYSTTTLALTAGDLVTIEAVGLSCDYTALTGSPGALTWGSITGTLGDQTDLDTALDALAPKGAFAASGLTMATERLLGRTTASSGAAEEITVGAGLSLSGGVLTATAGSGTTEPSYVGAVANTAALTGLTNAVVGSWANVGASSSAYIAYELKTAPYSTEANWQAIQGVLDSGTARTVTVLAESRRSQLVVKVATATEVTVTIDGGTAIVLLPSATPSVVLVYDELAVAAPASISIQRTSGSDNTGWFSFV